MTDAASNVAVEQIEVSAAVLKRAVALGTAIVVLPRRIEGEAAIYGEATVDLVKRFRAAGITADFADPAGHRRFEVKKGMTGDVVQFVALAIASGVTYDLAKAAVLQAIALFGGQPLELEYTHIDEAGQKTSWRLKGAAADIADIVEKLPTGMGGDDG